MVTQTQMTQTQIKVVAIGGQAQNGKTTLAHLLQSHAQFEGWHVNHFAFADPLKSIVRIVQQDFVNKNPDALQATSDQWKLLYGTSIFAKDLIARLNAHAETVPSFIDKILYLVPDLRFRVELDALDNIAAPTQVIKVRVIRPSFVNTDRDMLHPSETELLDVVYENYRVEADDMSALVTDAAELWKLLKG
jgi:hypothetical protein